MGTVRAGGGWEEGVSEAVCTVCKARLWREAGGVIRIRLPAEPRKAQKYLEYLVACVCQSVCTYLRRQGNSKPRVSRVRD